ncbi:MAG: class I SAM-dependent methyltransferase [Paracoccaceae bacterium]
MLLSNDTRRRGNFILTSMGLRRKGFFTPYDFLEDASWDQEPYEEVMSLFASRLERFRDFLGKIGANSVSYQRIAAEPGLPAWDTRFFSRLDGAALYTAMTEFRPERVVEIGSGHSTHFMARAIEDHDLGTWITCIDPAPRTSLAQLPVLQKRRVLDLSDVALFAELDPGDVVFVDSSHILQQGFDVDIILNRILPVLASGVIIHFHDIFLPYGYRSPWQSHRFNEQGALIGWLLTGKLDPLFASYYMWKDHSQAIDAACPDFPLNTSGNGGSLWLRVT